MTIPNPSLTLIILSWKLKSPSRPRLHRTTPESDISLGGRSFKGGQELFNGWVHKGATEGVHARMCVGLDNPRLDDGFYFPIVRDLSDTSSIWHDEAWDKRAALDTGGYGPQLFDGVLWGPMWTLLPILELGDRLKNLDFGYYGVKRVKSVG
ncbi:MAG: hypothetical protein Q9175_002584 [Cornicularia normoerica]